MLLITAMTLICIGSAGFYVGFLIALCKECKAQWISYLVRLEPEAVGYTISDADVENGSLPRAA